MARTTRSNIPVLLGGNLEHVFAKSEIVEDEDKVTFTFTAEGSAAAQLVAFMTNGEPIALSFVAIPVIKHDRTL